MGRGDAGMARGDGMPARGVAGGVGAGHRDSMLGWDAGPLGSLC